MKRPRKENPAQNIATFVALLGLVVVCGALLLFVGLVFPQTLWMLVIAAGFVFLGAFHWLTWGRWLTRLNAEMEIEEDEFPEP